MAYYFRRSLLTLIWLAVAMLLLTSLISYSANDPSWSHLSSQGDTISNLAGRGGAWLSDILYTFLGASSWWLIAIACYEAWRLWYARTLPIGALRTLGYLFLIIATAALTGVMSLSWLAQGIVGQVVGEGLSSLLTHVGAWLFLVVFIGITLMFTFNLQLHKIKALFKKSDFNPALAHSTNRTAVNSAEEDEEETVTAKVLPTTQQLPLPLEGEADTGRFGAFLDETGFSEAKEYEWMENEANIANNPFKPISSVHLANTKLTKKLDAKLKNEVIRTPKTSPTTTSQTSATSAQPSAQQGLTNPQFADEASSADELDKSLDRVSDSKNLTSTEPTATQPKPAKTLFGMNFASFKLNIKKPAPADKQDVIEEDIENQQDFIYNNQDDSNYQEPIDDTVEHKHVAMSLDPDFDSDFLTVNADDDVAEDSINQPVTNLAYDVDDTDDDNIKGLQQAINSLASQPTSAQSTMPNHPIQAVATQAEEPRVASVAELLGMRVATPSPIAEQQATLETQRSQPSNEGFVPQNIAPQPLAAHERSVEIDELKPIEPSSPTPLDIHNDALFAGKSRAMQTAAYRASLSPLPPLDLLDLPDPDRTPSYSRQELQQLSELLEIKLQEFNVKANVVNAQLGPVVTRFEVELAPGVKASKVTGIAKDLARSLSMASVRVVEVIPGKPYIGIEVPNPHRQMVRLIELLKTEDFQDPNGLISMAMGKDIAGRPVITDLAKAPHMLVAGTTGSGKSVLVNSLLLSMLLKYTPDQLRMILIDPKQLELANYNDIPHLLTPVVTDMTEAASALSWCVAEMERRYQLMSLFKVRKLDEFNKKVIAANAEGHPLLDPLWRVHDSVSQDKPPVLKPLPQIVIVADEFADMMMQVGKQAEELITRLAQKSRAAGIHLILATQRPSVDVITGLIKANIPVRAALRVNSKVDSRTILDAGGAEDMLGHGDMLFLAPGQNEPNRVHGAFISDSEVNRICDAWRERGAPDYIDNMFDNFALTSPSGGGSDTGGIATGDEDALYDEVVAFVLETRKVSASSIQRKFSIGYNRAARIVDAMEEAGLVSAMGKSGKRELLV